MIKNTCNQPILINLVLKCSHCVRILFGYLLLDQRLPCVDEKLILTNTKKSVKNGNISKKNLFFLRGEERILWNFLSLSPRECYKAAWYQIWLIYDDKNVFKSCSNCVRIFIRQAEILINCGNLPENNNFMESITSEPIWILKRGKRQYVCNTMML